MTLSRITLHAIILTLLCLSAGLQSAGAAGPVVIVAEASLQSFTDRIESLGTLTSNESLELTAAVTETLSAIHFDDGERVAQDQILVEMSSAEERAQLEEAAAMVNEAFLQYQRVLSLENRGTAAVSQLDERKREWETARARLAIIESRLADRQIKAPFAGVLGLRDLSVGALVKPGDLITTIDDDAVMKLEFPLPATYLKLLRPGLDVIATARAYAEQRFEGKVKSVDSRVDPATRSIRVRALLPNPKRLLKPGMLMLVELLNNPRQAILIPEEGLLPEGDRQYVLKIAPGSSKAVRQEVKIGGRRPGAVEVIDGLAPGDLVVTHGSLKVRDGQEVVVGAVDDGSRSLDELLRSLGAAGSPQ